MDRHTVFTKTAKGLMEATGKTSVLSRDMRAVLKEIDGKLTVGDVHAKLGKVPEAKLQDALQALAKNDFIREFMQPQSAVPPPRAAAVDTDLDFTMAIPTMSATAKKAEEAARQKAQAEAAARAKAEADARAKAAAAEAAARAKAEAEAKARAAAEVRAKAEAEARAKREVEERARKEAERKAKEQAERERKEAEEKARREADELRARLEAERQAREDAARKAKEEAEQRAKQEAERKAREDAERQLREEAERKAKEEAERERKEAEDKARREADELRARLEEERKAREEAERRVKEEAERRAQEDAERQAREQAERQRQEAEAQARQEAEERARAQEQERAEAEARARSEAEESGRREAEEQARREAKERARAQEQERIQAEARARKETEDAERRAEEEAERKAQEQVERERREAEEKSARVTAEQQAQAKSGPTLEDLVSIETNFDAALGTSGGALQDAARNLAGADDQLRKQAEEQARLQAEEQASQEAAETARAQADAEARRAEEERLRREEEERQQARAPDDAGDRAAAQMREHAEAQALLDAENAETERHFAEMEKELDAEQALSGGRIQASESREDARARDETRERVRAAAAAPAAEAAHEAEPVPVAYRRRIEWGKPVAIGLFLLLVLGLILVHFISFDAYIPQFEKLAGAHMQQPVKIKALHLSLVPQPHWRLDGVSVGTAGQLVVPRVNAIPELGSLFSEKKVFTSIELESPVLGEDGLLALLFGKPAGQDFKVARIIVTNGKLDSKTFILPALDAKIALGEDGAWRQIALETPDHKTSLLLKPEGEGAELEVETNAFSLPFRPAFILENFVAKGVIRRDELRLSEFKGGIYGGYLSGNANLKWGAGWSLGGEINVRAMDPARFAPALMEEGKLEGKAVYAMRAKSYDELFAAPRLEGGFSVLKGTLVGVELARLLQGGGVGGKTTFTELTGGFTHEAGKTQLRQIRLSAGPVSAGGSAEVDAGKHISGRFAVEIKSPVAQARANFAVAGTLREPHFSR